MTDIRKAPKTPKTPKATKASKTSKATKTSKTSETRPSLELDVQFAAAAFAAHKAALPRACLVQWVRAALCADAQLTLRFVDEAEGRTLNRTWRGKDYATNVLTFAYAESLEDPVTADVVLCCPVVAREAAEQHKLLVPHYAHLIVHGVLHAQGYDHENDTDAAEMENFETEVLTSLGFPNPYL
jgi:probable rRNA maturation factor